MWDKIAYLGTVEETKQHGEMVRTIKYDTMVFCNEKSVKYQEFYQAHATGLKPEIVLEVNQTDYNSEQYIKYEDKEYTVLRTYKIGPDIIELTLQRGVDDVTT